MRLLELIGAMLAAEADRVPPNSGIPLRTIALWGVGSILFILMLVWLLK